MNRKIAWEKWYDLPENDQYSSFENDLDQEENHENEHLIPMASLESIFMGPKIYTPIGIFEYDDQMSPGKMFDCWIGHCNFPLYDNEMDILDNIPGIECLERITKYRFFIGVGKMFNFITVRTLIQHRLCKNLEEPEIISNNVDDLICNTMQKINDTFLSIGSYSQWAIFIGNDGHIQSICGKDFNSEEEYQQSLKELKSLKNGNIITCDGQKGV